MLKNVSSSDLGDSTPFYTRIEAKRDAVLVLPSGPVDVRYWPEAEMGWCATQVRFREQSGHDFFRRSAFTVAIRGKADMRFCGANVAS